MKSPFTYLLLAGCFCFSSFSSSLAQSTSCGNLVFNGDFETYNPPLRGILGNVASPSPANTGDELTGWQSTNTFDLSYYNTNGPARPQYQSSNPGNSPYGSFTPYNNSAGAIGLITYSRVLTPFINYPENYIAGTLTSPLDGGFYYASMQVRSASVSPPVSQFARIGIDITVASPIDYSSVFPYKLFTPTGCGIQSSTYITNTANWTRVSGIFQGIPGAQHINIGNFDPYNFDPYNSTVNPSNFAYAYVDQVEVFKIPTAGSNISCLNSPIILGEGCAIPGARYAWTKDGGSVFATTLHPTISPSTYAVYTLTVTLPDGSTYSSDVEISDCNCTKQMQNIDIEDRDVCSNSTLYFVPVYDAGPFDQAYAGSSGFTWSVTGQAYAQLGTSPVSGRVCLFVVPNRSILQPIFEVSMTYHYADGCTASTTNYQSWDYSSCYPYRQATYTATPNPVASELTIIRESPTKAASSAAEKNTVAQAPIEVRLYNSFGKLVKEGKGTANQLVLDVQDLPDGIYYLRSGYGENVISKSIEVRH